MIEKLFSQDVVTVETDRQGRVGELFPEEAAVVRNAVARRQREFALGRRCARQALHRMGVGPQPILVGAHREPLWPEGVVGSITHSGRYCAAAVARADRVAGLGVDAEATRKLDAELIATICTPAEIDWCSKQPPAPHGDWYMVIFSAKESVYKCLFPIVRRVLEHHEVEVRLQPTSEGFSVSILFEPPDELKTLPAIRGRFAIGPELTFTGAEIARP